VFYAAASRRLLASQISSDVVKTSQIIRERVDEEMPLPSQQITSSPQSIGRIE
jgi:hypothetical protein